MCSSNRAMPATGDGSSPHTSRLFCLGAVNLDVMLDGNTKAKKTSSGRRNGGSGHIGAERVCKEDELMTTEGRQWSHRSGACVRRRTIRVSGFLVLYLYTL